MTFVTQRNTLRNTLTASPLKRCPLFQQAVHSPGDTHTQCHQTEWHHFSLRNCVENSKRFNDAVTKVRLYFNWSTEYSPFYQSNFQRCIPLTLLATGWTVRGSNPGRGEIFRNCSDRPWGLPSLLYNGYRVFPGGKERPRRYADPSTLLVPWSRRSIAIRLLPLWAVRPVQSLSACTRVHFTFAFYSTNLGALINL